MDIAQKLSPEEIDRLCDSFIHIFNRVKEELEKIETRCRAYAGGKPVTEDIKLSPRRKVLTVLKKLTLNSTISAVSDIPPEFLDNDLSALRNNSYESFLRCDLFRLVYGVTTDALQGTTELLNRLRSPERRTEALENIYSFYMAKKDDDYLSGKRHDYTVMLAILFNIHSDIYNDMNREKFMALTNRGYDIEMPYDFFADIKEICMKHPLKTTHS